MMADPSWQYINHPHRKALPSHLNPQASPASANNIYAHSRSRTTSSSIFPIPPTQNQNQAQNSPGYPPSSTTMFANPYSSRRTPSTNTFSTTASSSFVPNQNRAPSTEIRRSTSSRSGGAPTGYVALMRKQKATVWCDRAQTEDPRHLAAQRAAKLRAASEVSSSARASTLSSSSAMGASSTNRVAAKIRHHGKSGLVGYGSGTGDGNFGVGVGGVPMRLSASEVEGGDSDSDNERNSGSYGGYNHGGMYHHRTGSGRSSLGSERRRTGLQYRQSGASGNSGSGRWSSGNTPPSGGEGRNGSGLSSGAGERNGSLTELAEETPMPTHNRQKDYFSSSDGPSHSHPVSTTSRTQTNASAKSNGSGSSGERADAVGELGAGSEAARLASNSLLQSTIDRNKSTRSGGSTGVEELRRRGSVDERTMTITGGVGRLFVANPDLSDNE